MDVVGRDEEKRRLEDFLNCDKNVAWFQLAGVAGQGKSRLAFDLVKHAIDDLGWNAGFLEENGIRRFRDKWFTWQPDKPHLIVFDYVVGREDDIKPILQDLSERQDELLHNVRILLLERQRWDQGMSVDSEIHGRPELNRYLRENIHGEKAGWYINLCKNNDYDGDDYLLKKSRYEDGVVELNKLGEDDLAKIVKKVMDIEFSVEAKLSDTEIGETLQQIDKSGRPLYAYFLAQELAHDESTSGWSSHTLLNKTLARERDAWWSVAFDSKPPVYEDDVLATRLAVLSTMLGGLDCNDISHKGLIPKPTPDDRRKALVLTGCVVSRDNKNIDGPPVFIPPMKPDLLGEWYVIASFSKKGLPLKELTNIAWKFAPESMSGFTQRLCQDFLVYPVVEEMLVAVDLEQVAIKPLSKVANIMFDYRCFISSNKCPEPIIRALHLRADEGDPVSMCNLGYCYSDEASVEMGTKTDLNKSFDFYDKAAKMNMPYAMYKVAEFYKCGIAREQNIDKAIEYYNKAANAGNALAFYELGSIYEKGKGVRKDLHKAVDYYWRVICANYSNSYEDTDFSSETIEFFDDIFLSSQANEMAKTIYKYGIRCLRGQGVPKDTKIGLGYLKKAAIAGSVPAMFEVGYCYIAEIGTDQDITKAIEFFKKAAEQGHAGAMHYLAVCYREGGIVERDDQQIFELFQKAAKAGYADSMNSLGICYQTGSGVAQNLQKAVFWYQEGANAGNSKAMYNLGLCYGAGNGVEADIKKTIKWYRKAAELGFFLAMKDLGLFYLNEEFELYNPEKAFYWLDRAAHADAADPATLPYVLMFLGYCYQEGVGIESDSEKAFEWYSKSHELGEVRALASLGSCYAHGVGVEADLQKAIGYYKEFLQAEVDVSAAEKKAVKEELSQLLKKVDT